MRRQGTGKRGEERREKERGRQDLGAGVNHEVHSARIHLCMQRLPHIGLAEAQAVGSVPPYTHHPQRRLGATQGHKCAHAILSICAAHATEHDDVAFAGDEAPEGKRLRPPRCQRHCLLAYRPPLWVARRDDRCNTGD